jgi:hypothetical protein
LSGDAGDSASKNQDEGVEETMFGPSPGQFYCHGIPLGSGLRSRTEVCGEKISDAYSSEW